MCLFSSKALWSLSLHFETVQATIIYSEYAISTLHYVYAKCYAITHSNDLLPNIPKQIIARASKSSSRLITAVRATSTGSNGTSMAPTPKLLILLHAESSSI